MGPEVAGAARGVLERVAEFDFETGAIGASAIRAHGHPLPEPTIALCERADAVLLGAVGDPEFSDPDARARPEDGLLSLRSRFELFANLRPVRSTAALAATAPLRSELLDGVDMLFVRELTSGIYFGKSVEQGQGSDAHDTMSYSVHEVERVAALAFKMARMRRAKVTSIDKANVLASSRLWRRTVTDQGRRYPDIELEHMLVDAAAMHLITRPADFDVVLTPNLFGDILSDEASVIAGSLGMLPSASLGRGSFGVYEPVHGSAPDIAGLGLANPCGAILSVAMMLRFSLGLPEEAARVERSLERVLEDGTRTADLAPTAGTRPALPEGGDAEARTAGPVGPAPESGSDAVSKPGAASGPVLGTSEFTDLVLAQL